MNNNEYTIVSLGNDCFSRCCVTHTGLKPRKAQGELSMPFDMCWYKHTNALIHHLENDFSDYFDDIVFDKEKNIYVNDKYSTGYNHDLDCENTPEGKQKLFERYERRIENFRNCLKSDKFLFFIYKPPEKAEQDCNKIYEILKKERKKDFKFIVIDVKEQYDRALLDKNIELCSIMHPFDDIEKWWFKENEEIRLKYYEKITEMLKNIMKNELIKYEKSLKQMCKKINININMEKIVKTLMVVLNFSDFSFFLVSKLKPDVLEKFLKHKIKKGTILVAEPNFGHGEVLPGIIEYCNKLGYTTEVLITNEKLNEVPLPMFKNIKMYGLSVEEYEKVLQSGKLNEYEKVIFTSSRVYYNYPRIKVQFIFDYFRNCKMPKPLLIEHHFDELKEEEKKEFKFAGLPFYSKDYGIKMVNPHYFGQFPKVPKNETAHFVIAGSIEKERKNHDLIIDAAISLIDKGMSNFIITIIGGGKRMDIPQKLANTVYQAGRLTYKDMYDFVCKADYILALFDPKNPDHDRYIKKGTSGTYQLSYGFLKPLIINEKFCENHHLNNGNCIIYKENNLAEAMEFAIKESQELYSIRVENLKKLEAEIYSESLQNLKEMLKD